MSVNPMINQSKNKAQTELQGVKQDDVNCGHPVQSSC